MHVKPVLVDCSFIVDQANANGLGERSLKGGLVNKVFMHTSAPLAGSGNPNPPAGYIYMLLDNSYNRYLGEFSSQSAPLSGSSLTAVVANSVYTIVSLGTASLAQWQAVGLTPGIVPAVGSTFVASSSGTIGGSAAVQAPLAAGSGIDHIEAIGDPNMTIGNIISNPPKGRGYVVFACFKNGVITQPTDGSTISIAAYFNDSSVLIAGA